MIPQNNNPVYMRQYLEYVVEFEKYVWVWKNAMNTVNNQLQNLYNKRNSLDASVAKSINESNAFNVKYHAQEKVRRENGKKFLKRAVFSLVGFVIGGIILLALLFMGNEAAYPLFWFELFCLIFGIYNASKYFSNKSRISEMKKIDLNSASEALINDRKNEAESFRINSLDEERQIKEKQSEIFTSLQNAQNSLKDIYSVNVLPNKYRSLCAAATMLGYLTTGRCNTIQGHGGIYDTYEIDMQNRAIITKLTELRDISLRIEANQQLLLQEMRNANNMLANINQTVNRIDLTTRQIEKNTAISAVANQQTAAAASWIAWRT